jgi:hypothetical protein
MSKCSIYYFYEKKIYPYPDPTIQTNASTISASKLFLQLATLVGLTDVEVLNKPERIRLQDRTTAAATVS